MCGNKARRCGPAGTAPGLRGRLRLQAETDAKAQSRRGDGVSAGSEGAPGRDAAGRWSEGGADESSTPPTAILRAANRRRDEEASPRAWQGGLGGCAPLADRQAAKGASGRREAAGRPQAPKGRGTQEACGVGCLTPPAPPGLRLPRKRGARTRVTGLAVSRDGRATRGRAAAGRRATPVLRWSRPRTHRPPRAATREHRVWQAMRPACPALSRAGCRPMQGRSARRYPAACAPVGSG